MSKSDTLAAKNTDVFKSRLKTYKAEIDKDIESYSKVVQNSTLQSYGVNSRVAIDAYLEVLGRGGKRIRGALVMQGYEMCGGKDHKMILQAARAIEMIHAYILIIDDINDHSLTRRGGKAAHAIVADYYNTKELGHDSQHFGESIAMNAALSGNHAAQMVMANLSVDESLKLAAINILNRGMLITVHGQFNDIFNEVSGSASEDDVNKVTKWKTAHYTFLNPLHIGMILAGADCHATDAITPYAMHVGQAFQIVDDILGTFGSEFETGKSPMDDTREGKRTLLSVYALEHAKPADKNFLVQMLGNQNLTKAEFKRCQEIILSTGALDYSRKQADKHIQAAIQALDDTKGHWTSEGDQFLHGLANYLLDRQT